MCYNTHNWTLFSRKKKEIMLFVVTFTELEDVMPNEISKGQRDMRHIISLSLYNIKKLLSQKIKVVKWVSEGGRGMGCKGKRGSNEQAVHHSSVE